MRAAPAPSSGTCTFLFTDIEGSTRLVQALGDAYVAVLSRHRQLIDAAVTEHGGRVFGDEGDALFATFGAASAALLAAVDAQHRLAAESWPDGVVMRVRMGIHSGDATALDGDFVGVEVHRTARLTAAGHGGQILVSEATRSLVTDALPPETELRDLGEHRLKDLQRPERIFQVVAPRLGETFPALKTLDAAPNNLPPQMTTFVGREAIVAEVRELLMTTRVLTLTGPGGTGKTRLALHVAGEVVGDFPDGVFFVPLAAVTDAALVPSAIAASLGLHETVARSPIQRVIEHLGERRVLLVLDNVEQVVDAGERLADVVAACPAVRLLVTSRAPLHIYGEQEFPVPPLALPDDTTDPERLLHSEAVRLFVERARAIRPDFRLTRDNGAAVAELCRQLDGLPLAIELAAARIKMLAPQAMLARLERRLDLLASGARDLPARQRTLRGAIMWSHDLLDAPLRRLFARSSVFRGGAALVEAEQVLGSADELGVDVMDGLARLVDHSLVRQVASDGDPRFVMLETIREFAYEQLVAGDDAEVTCRRHTVTYLRLAQALAPHLTGADAGRHLDRLELELGNLRAAIEWALAEGDVRIAVEMGSALWRFWQMRGHLREGERLMRRVLELPDIAADPQLHVAALDAAGGIAYWQADAPRANALYGQALAIRRAIGDLPGVAEELYNLSMANGVGLMGDADVAREAARESLDISRRLGDVRGQARALWSLGQTEAASGDVDAAEPSLLEAVQLFERVGDRFMLAWSQYSMGVQDFRRRRYDDARHRWTDALRRFVAGRDMTGYELLIDTFSWLAFAEGDKPTAMRLAGLIDALRERTGSGLGDVTRRQDAGFDVRDWLHDDELAAAYEDGRQMRLDDAIALLLGDASSPGAAHRRGPAAGGQPASIRS